jgi:hypothetical protein
MRLISVFFFLIGKAINILVVITLVGSILFIVNKGNQPMQVPGAPKELTYWEFITDRIEAAKTVQPARCGWGMFLSFGLLGPIYSVVYTDVAIHPNGFLARVTAPDPDIPKDAAGVKWYQAPGIWWNVVERLSWSMLAKHHAACNLRTIRVTKD